MFPLQLVVFPGEKLPLHVFEPRYKQLVMECRSNGTTFGVPAYIDGAIKDVGTEVELSAIQKTYPRGEMDILCTARGLFRIDRFFQQAPNRLYAAAEITRLEASGGTTDPFLAAELLSLLQTLFSNIHIKQELPDDAASFKVFEVGHQLGLSIQQEYTLLTLSTEMERQQFVLEHMQKILPTIQEMESLRRKAQMNGHFKNVIPPDFDS